MTKLEELKAACSAVVAVYAAAVNAAWADYDAARDAASDVADILAYDAAIDARNAAIDAADVELDAAWAELKKTQEEDSND
jgi:hypothetical protein